MIQNLKGKNDTYIFNAEHKADVISTGERYFHVFRGKSSTTNCDVLIKQIAQPNLISNEQHAQIVEEILLNINNLHSGIAQTLDVIQSDDSYFIVREYVQGVSLHNFIFDPDYSKIRSAQLLAEITRQLCEISATLHANGIVHRNIKPANIIVMHNSFGQIDTVQPRIKLVDFERIQITGRSMLNFGRLPISRVYSSPEMVLQQANLIHTTTDIFSLGITLFELFARVPAYNTTNQDLILNMQVAFPLKKTPEMKKQLFAILHKASFKHVFRKPPTHYDASEAHNFLKNAVASRYLSVTDLWRDLEGFFAQQGQKKPLLKFMKR
ncbi:MAG: protein kinase [Bacteroidetes bacterium]|nr:protein kinase [Bacteroidota bacterium]